MLFNSLPFVAFFAVVLGLYFTLPWAWRWKMLLAASCVFYMAFIPKYLAILGATIAIDYWMAIRIEQNSGRRRQLCLVVSILATCLVLFVFKYYDFFLESLNGLFWLGGSKTVLPLARIILPIGLSFHTFQSLSYVIEVYRGRQRAERHFGLYSLYVMFFPQLVAGPIERPQNLLHQFREDFRFNADDFVAGAREAAWGYFKKMVVADRMAIYVNRAYGDWTSQDGLTLVVATLFFAIQIYADFSGYSSIAIGLARMMGFRLMTNFRRPYFASGISDFWRRWHISLSTWFRDYLYIPLGGSRCGGARLYFNLLVTFFVSGIWHGARWTFAIWGLYNGALLIVEHALTPLLESAGSALRAIWRVGAMMMIVAGWVFFRAESLSAAADILKRILTQTHLTRASAEKAVLLYAGDNTSLALMLTAIFFALLMFAIELAGECEWFPFHPGLPSSQRRFGLAAALVGLQVALVFGILRPSAFIYFQF